MRGSVARGSCYFAGVRKESDMKTRDMTTGNPLKLLMLFAFPLMLGNVFQQLYTVVDTMVVGQVLGVKALAALGADEWTNWMMLGIIQGFTQGFSIRIAQNFGAGNTGQLKKDTAVSAILSLLLACILLAAGQLVAEPILRLQRTPAEILPDSLLYLRILFGGIPIVMAYNLLSSLLRALGDGKTPLYAVLIACVINIGLDILFVKYLGFGIAGAAAATLTAQLCSALFCLYAVGKLSLLKPEKEDFRMNADLCGKLMWLGTPMAFMNAIIAVGGMIVQSVVNTFGVIFLAGMTATGKLYGLLEIAATSYGYAVVTYTGQNLGAGRPKRIREGVRAALLVAIVTSALITACMLLFGKGILRLFIQGTPREVEAAMEIAYRDLTVMSVFLFILYVLYVIRSAIQGLGDTLLPMVSGLAEFAVRTGTAFLLPFFFGREGLYFVEVSAWIGADVILLVSYFIKIRQLKKRFPGIV